MGKGGFIMAENYTENKKALRKIISYVSIASVAVAGLIGLGVLFKIIPMSDVIGNVLLSVLIVFLAGLCLLNASEAVAKKNKLGLITAALVIISSALFLVMVWAGKYFGDFYEVYSKITVIVAMATLLFDLFIGNYIVMKTKYLLLQIIDYVAFLYVEVAISMAILGNNVLVEHYLPLVAAIIVFLVLFAILRIKVKEKRTENVISKEEYETLKAENERLKKILSDNGIQY